MIIFSKPAYPWNIVGTLTLFIEDSFEYKLHLEQIYDQYKFVFFLTL